VRKAPTYAFLPALPNIEFKTPAKKTNDPKGSADPGYLTTLYAKIMQNMHAPRPPAVAPNYRGRVVFGVLSDGRIIQVALAAPSGFRELDEAALAAVRKGAPYPRPPNGGPVYIRFDYGTR
jgi:protein TonB